jgi:hypothetical protein
MEGGLSRAQLETGPSGVRACCLCGGGSASADVDGCVKADMRGSGPHDRVCELEKRSRSLESSIAQWAAPNLRAGRFSRLAGALSSPGR